MMPIYTYVCPECDQAEEHIVRLSERDTKVFLCPVCGERMKRGVDRPNLGKPAYQMEAIFSDGSRQKGHFGKTAKKK